MRYFLLILFLCEFGLIGTLLPPPETQSVTNNDVLTVPSGNG